MNKNISRLESIINKSDDSADVFLFGGIGDKIDGDFVAEEIRRLDNQVSTINVKINSGGGSIISGFSIISAILNAEAFINTYNEGIAASMAGVILLTGDKIFMSDFSRLMLHEPSFLGETIDTTKDEKIKNTLIALKGSLSTIIQNRTGKKEGEVDKILADETWFTAKQAKKQGFIDEIVRTKRKIKNDMTADEIINRVAAEYINKFNNNETKNDMELICNHLELNKDSDQAAVLNKIKEIQKDKASVITNLNTSLDTEKETVATLTEEKAVLETEKKELQNKLVGFEAKEVESNKENAKRVVEEAITAGKFDEKQKESLIAKAEADLEGFKSLIAAIPEVPANIIAQLTAKGDAVEGREKWTIRDWEKKDSKGLQNMLDTNIENYKRLYKAFYKSDYKI